jgi:hypothetical protein
MASRPVIRRSFKTGSANPTFVSCIRGAGCPGTAPPSDLQGRPLVQPSTHPAALVGTADDAVVAEWLGMKIILDVNIPLTSGSGNQDYVILGYSPDWLLYESLPNFEVDK